MSCNSTYLLDKQTDHGCKADELASLLEDVLEDPEAKAVVFSQWVGMLGLLSFKKSVFSGVLDGGAKEVFLGGTRLKQFMDSVDQATGAVPPPMPADDGSGAAGRAEPAPVPVAAVLETVPQAGAPAGPGGRPPSPALSPHALSDLLTAGAALLGQSLRQGAASSPDGDLSAGLANLVSRDEATGQTYLKLPLPKPDVLGPLVNLLQGCLGQGR
jgi:hypothetical protein